MVRSEGDLRPTVSWGGRMVPQPKGSPPPPPPRADEIITPWRHAKPPPPVVNGRLLREQRCFCWGAALVVWGGCCIWWAVRCCCGGDAHASCDLLRPRRHCSPRSFRASMRRTSSPSSARTAQSLPFQPLANCCCSTRLRRMSCSSTAFAGVCRTPPPAPRPSCSVPSQRLVPATPLHGPLPTPCPDSGWSSPCKPRCITTLWSIQWGSLYDDMRRGAFSVPIPCPSVGPSTAAPKNRKRTPGDTSGVTHLFVFCGGKPPFGCPQSDPQ